MPILHIGLKHANQRHDTVDNISRRKGVVAVSGLTELEENVGKDENRTLSRTNMKSSLAAPKGNWEILL